MSDVSSTGFVVGLPYRADAAATSRVSERALAPAGFSPADLIQRIERAFGGNTAETVTPRHFAPADRGDDPTAGWDPLDSAAEPTPYLDPLELARAEGYEDGVAAATVAARDAAERDRMLLTTLGAALKAGGAIDRDALAAGLRRTVMMLVRQLIGEAGVSGELLAARVSAATDLLADASESAMLRVHPDDVALLEGHLPDTIFPIGDAQVARGSFILEAASTIVEDGPELWLETLEAAVERAAVPAPISSPHATR
ncbi:FliH/SctL family protein [Sphingomonas sp.]|jgi:flagellar assembly protein FliH|uniref:FliH/SctL family protein n=1 Tax=Sphingomonas sp. TaxID=28214 RepID=UPI0035C7926A